MLDQIKQFVDELPKSNQKICYAMGYDAAMNGADEKNCHFSLFSSKENTAAWEAGNRQGVKDREAAQQKMQRTTGTRRQKASSTRKPATVKSVGSRSRR